tara:strand:- start:2713 stop:3186 length:474 start_codon:yes stop_codon:yes gene_type:complete
MKKILSKEQCNSILNQVESQEWQRIDFHCRYDQTFIEDSSLIKSFQEFFGKEFNSIPIMKVLRLQEGDGLPLYSGDYDSVSDDAFKRYHGTNFIIECYLNDNFIGGEISVVNDTYTPIAGNGIIQKRSQICSISNITNGTAYLIFCYVKGFVSNNLL